MPGYRIAVFASGQGSNFQALVDAAASGKLDATIELLVSDRPQAPVVEKAEAAGIECHVFKPKEYASREAYEQEIVAKLEEREIDLVVLAGYMRLLTSVVVDRYAGRLINIHPSLLPAFPGKDAIGQALDYGVKMTGITVHFVDGGMDTGAIIAQRAITVSPEDTTETLAASIHELERELYPEVVSWFTKGLVTLDGRKVTIAENDVRK
ncbi:phosphoribosylglycinamide formyltransferase [Paenibacillus urinalis]|uniref:Phosphoribosylglycinamide formyltransferase n=2 Tax=Paenibacillus TaxID=44249 RepID=A0ABY7XB61_9BACL|nr:MULTISPECIES: phosphoribosylglycinamide formyltransferase [Paenibacillus]OMC72398.1 phosphoribosylglycinamide formyltransferase [Paenibacillus sp. FSL H7-0326]WDH99325.1 phosphoribosylglycinamide formyltransferase [Paenibacillus urinalis]WDI03019.1 phosphoribosylglycinamide formyltransferase [Paenibacillus urinalis]SDX40190.1 phosphoribosylglycinamide formyltransferase-1 [Paenibacillus sp. PDC88]GAK41707.1 phosphoribosylglycinamide formyltransferase [Paenibacillus sp. TCA20]